MPVWKSVQLKATPQRHFHFWVRTFTYELDPRPPTYLPKQLTATLPYPPAVPNPVFCGWRVRSSYNNVCKALLITGRTCLY